MDIIELYSHIIKSCIKRPRLALWLIKTGLSLENIYLSFPDARIPQSLRYLNRICIKYILEPLKHPENSGWVNLFAPSEILHAMDIYPLFVEAFSSFLTGLRIEDMFIDHAEKVGVSETLCSYHKAFIGAALMELLPNPRFAVTSSIICDSNINTFRFLSEKKRIPFYVIDVPERYSKEAEEYVADQLKEMTAMIEDVTGKKLKIEKLKEIIKRENEVGHLIKKYIKKLKHKYFPSTPTLEMYRLFTTYVFMGRKETHTFYRMLVEDIEKYPDTCGTRIFWIHLLPFYHDALNEYLSLNDRYQILGCDLNFNYLEEMNCQNPYRAIAKKMILNKYNGSYDRKIENILGIIDKLNADAIIHFCHWGCKQSNGGVMLLKNAVKKRGIPFLVLEGDGVDRRSAHSAQIKTRLEAFLEMVENRKQKRGSK